MRSPLTERQLRDAIDALHARKFFAKLNPSRRAAYFSIRMNHDELANALFHLKTFKAKQKEEERLRNLTLQAKIKAALLGKAGTPGGGQ